MNEVSAALDAEYSARMMSPEMVEALRAVASARDLLRGACSAVVDAEKAERSAASRAVDARRVARACREAYREYCAKLTQAIDVAGGGFACEDIDSVQQILREHVPPTADAPSFFGKIARLIGSGR